MRTSYCDVTSSHPHPAECRRQVRTRLGSVRRAPPHNWSKQRRLLLSLTAGRVSRTQLISYSVHLLLHPWTNVFTLKDVWAEMTDQEVGGARTRVGKMFVLPLVRPCTAVSPIKHKPICHDTKLSMLTWNCFLKHSHRVCRTLRGLREILEQNK